MSVLTNHDKKGSAMEQQINVKWIENVGSITIKNKILIIYEVYFLFMKTIKQW